MSDMNRATIEGRLASDPKVFNTDTGKIVRITVASTEHYKKDGEIKEHTYFNPVGIYDKYKADYAEKNLHKGSHVLIEGAVETHSYLKDDETRYSTEVSVRPGKGFLKALDVKPKDMPAAEASPDLKTAAGQRQQQQQLRSHDQ